MLTRIIGERLRAGRWLLLTMLGLLHAVMLSGLETHWASAILLAHLGLFLIWQPLWRGEGEVSPSVLAFIVLAALVVMFWLNWWVIAFWITALFGLVGARITAFSDRWARVLYLLVMAYLLAILLLWVVPHLFDASRALEGSLILVRYVLPLLLLLIAVLPLRNQAVEVGQAMDFIYSLLLFMLLTLMVLGSLAFMTLAQLDYLEALLRTLLLAGIILLVLGGLWAPRFGFGGLQVTFSRYLLNLGTPFESWLARLAEAAQLEPNAANYLQRAIELLCELHWLSGLSWQTEAAAGESGQFSEHSVSVREGDLRLTLYAKYAFNPAVLMHLQLLAQLIGHFYQAKQREQTLRDISRLQAVYETGARLTHDLKNILQSLLALTALAQNNEARAQQLLQQQLPLLGQRIELTLGKLRQPEESEKESLLVLSAWWGAAQQRYRHQRIDWRTDALSEQLIPSSLFDCVLDNLLDNALAKQRTQPTIAIEVNLSDAPCRLTVKDTGSPVPTEMADGLMRRVVASQNGLGVGLYQAARWAEQQGYRLKLAENTTGAVVFELNLSPER